MAQHLFRSAFAVLVAGWSGSAIAGQCFAPSDPVRLTSDEQRAVVLDIHDNPDVFKSDFSLMRTLKNILGTASKRSAANVSDADAKELLKGLLASFGEATLDNDEGQISFAVKPREGEKALTPDDLLNPDSPNRMIPVGLFNRLDLSPADHSHCGEYRIIYEKNGPRDGSGKVHFDKRFTIIFEAALPNPDPAGDRAQCESVWRLWKGFSQPGQNQVQIGQTLAKFYYEGGKLDYQTDFEPVVSFSHYGLIGAGQVRANAFVHSGTTDNGLNWHLRQWRVAFDEKSPTKPPSFQPEAVNETPFRGYFAPLANTAPAGTDPTRFRSLSGLFQNTFSHVNVSQLVAVDSIAAIPFGAPTTIADLIDNIGVDIDDKFYAVESDAGPFGRPAADDPAVAIGTNKALADSIDARLKGLKVDVACGISREHVLNRMAAMTCGGCHQFGTAKEIAPGVRWPLSLNFVHIDEDGVLSPLLLDRFLPFRFSLMTNLAAPKPVAQARPGVASGNRLSQQLRGQLSSFQATTEDVQQIQHLSDQVRKIDKAQPGAFVTFRKPD